MTTPQYFKSVYFPDYKKFNPTSNAFVLAFGEKNRDVYKKLQEASSNEIRELLDTDSYDNLNKRASLEGLSVNTYSLWYIRKKIELTTDNYPSISNIGKLKKIINTIIEGDCLEKMNLIPDKSIDMILCDLPYGTTQNAWDSTIPLDQLWKQYNRIIKDKGVVALTSQGLFTAQLMLSNPKMFRYKIVWMKSKSTNFLNAKKQPLRRHEDICIFYKSQPVYNPQMTVGEPYNKGFRKDQLTGSYGDFKSVEVKSEGTRYPTDIIYYKTAESEGPVLHPTQKPVELGRYLIRTYTNEGGVVLDNTCGSGSFLVSAILENRKFIGIEKNEEGYLHRKHKVDYIEICKKRIKNAQKISVVTRSNTSVTGLFENSLQF
jgi:site-specific DNA-methyltransferase (adenine-specific)